MSVRSEHDQRYRAAHRDEAVATTRAWRKANPGRVREHHKVSKRRVRLRKYGLDEAAYDTMVADQDASCFICHTPVVEKRLCVDHCHTTGKVRALLCNRCNLDVAVFDQPRERLDQLEAYVATQGATIMAEGEKLIVAAANLARAAPREWEPFVQELAAYTQGKREQCVEAPLDMLQIAQGRAQACAALLRLVQDAVKTADRILERGRAK